LSHAYAKAQKETHHALAMMRKKEGRSTIYFFSSIQFGFCAFSANYLIGLDVNIIMG